jgi:hypothetical protein
MSCHVTHVVSCAIQRSCTPEDGGRAALNWLYYYYHHVTTTTSSTITAAAISI